MTRKKRKKRKNKKYSGISEHKRNKSKLIAPLMNLQPPLKTVDWNRDWLPEHLWIDFLYNEYGDNNWIIIFDKFIDEIQKYCVNDDIHLGLITDFGLVSENKKNEFITNNKDLIYDAFHKPFGRIAAFYPDSPCYWLVLKSFLNSEPSLDPQIELNKLSESIKRLFQSKDLYAGHIRTAPFARLIKSGNLKIFNELESVKMLKEIGPRYPGDCNEEEKLIFQKFSRTAMMAYFQFQKRYEDKKWPKYFWNNNYKMSTCKTLNKKLINYNEIGSDEMNEIENVIHNNCKIAIDYLKEVSLKYRYNIYDPRNDEVLLGLFSRSTRIYSYCTSNPNLWSRDIIGIIIRCLAETAIIFKYLAEKGTDEEINNFRTYGEGKEKLLMLHLQDHYPGEKTINGEDIDDIADNLGGSFSQSLINIELKNWTEKSLREIAEKCDSLEIYRIIFDPTSSDVHGTWTSLKKINLQFCANPLHRFHLIPNYEDPPIYPVVVNTINKLYKFTVNTGNECLDFPKLKEHIEDIDWNK